jgi:hypothetical protein
MSKTKTEKNNFNKNKNSSNNNNNSNLYNLWNLPNFSFNKISNLNLEESFFIQNIQNNFNNYNEKLKLNKNLKENKEILNKFKHNNNNNNILIREYSDLSYLKINSNKNTPLSLIFENKNLSNINPFLITNINNIQNQNNNRNQKQNNLNNLNNNNNNTENLDLNLNSKVKKNTIESDFKIKYKTEKCKFWEINQNCKFGENVKIYYLIFNI